MRRWFPFIVIGLAVSSGCVSDVEQEHPVEPVGTAEDAQTEVVTINPCDSSWQLPAGYAPTDPNATVQGFHAGMSGTGSRWVGRGGELAIVRVDEQNKSKPFLWHLVVYPTSNAQAEWTVYSYRDRFPVWSKPIGYCWDDGKMHATKPPSGKSFVVAEWDPGCNCTPIITGRLVDLTPSRTSPITTRW